MDAEILKFLCANQGAVDADVLMCNLFPGSSANEVISNKNSFVLFCSNGQQKVVARTGLRLCKVKDCSGSCGLLHLCKNFLFSGLCHRRVCGFCHDMSSCYNEWLLKQHELDHLSRAELSILLLQSDSTLLPPICYEYNTGNDEFGRCQSGIACSKLHICRRYLSQDCRCSKTHDFYAPQPLKSLYEKGVPDSLICSLRSVYANREALRIYSRQSSAAPISTNATTSGNADQRQRHRGRERGGNKGQWGQKGNSKNKVKPLQRQQTTSCSSTLGDTSDLDLSGTKGLSEDDNVGQELNSSHCDLSAAGNDTSAKSTDKPKVKQRHRNRNRRGGKSVDRQRGGATGNEANLENPLQQQQTASNDNDALDLNIETINDGDKQQQDLNSPNSDVPAAGEDTNAESNNGFNVGQRQWNQGTGVNGGNAGKSLQQQTSTLSNAFGHLNLSNKDGLNEVNIQQQQTASSNDDVLESDVSDLYTEKGLKTDKKQQDPNSPHNSVAAVDTNAESNNGFNVGQRQWNQGTGVNSGQSLQQQQTSTLSNALANVGSLDLHNKDGLNDVDNQQQDRNPSKSNISAVGKDTDASNNSGQSTQQAEDLKLSSASGRSDKQDDQLQLHRSCSTDISAAGSVGDVGKTNKPVKDKTEICIYYIAGYCGHEDRCNKAHSEMPYRWQVQVGDFWTALLCNEAIEKDYCDPRNSHSSSSFPPVLFNTMTCGQSKVRRLSTPNSLVEPDFLHTTEWLWYWQDEFGNWILYGSDSRGLSSADIISSKLEQKFLNNNKDVVDFTAGSQSYSLSFQDMVQTNKRYGTKKRVSRRPLFVSAEDVKTKKVRKTPNSTYVPDSWDKTQIPPTGFLKVALQHTSDEYLKVEAHFCSTMQNFDIFKIERIQNKALWEVFQWQKNLMKNKNGGCNVAEKQLFHGTDSVHVDAICRNNFDWRICGTHGTVYGKGSYFARDAVYSHCYTGNTNIRTMFLSRVLVGCYTRGASSYVTPPSKDGGDVHFYDSCVDSVIDPSIFVVFEKHQIYPEYLIQYSTTDSLRHSVSPAPSTNQCVIA